ncbi:hypothetical protein [Botrimarina mediterranea]|uniref:Uncharacterized protein n=1 Tax=Botrimarina mediterranea TaxID=2528022 RepID=A0A518K6T7_9BACT|nr:hypothetical protein [Botrimarina mediterranea]QDV73509.1 hypothetical protein Spa11_17060 [Botrimarina mediterranea]QDV78027.1 hypothetical protein K2D_16320 [Planctomycetes bacterium K2D]
MLWPLILPLQITATGLVVAVIAFTVLAPKTGRKRTTAFSLGVLLAILAFVPSCTGVMLALDKIRFGRFEYQSYNEITDFRAQRYLPPSAVAISMFTYPNGYLAKYSISVTDFHNYLDELWEKYGKHSAVPRHKMSGEDVPPYPDEFDEYVEQGWPPLKNAITYYSPHEDDGGGAKYLFDKDAGVVYQRTGYW